MAWHNSKEFVLRGRLAISGDRSVARELALRTEELRTKKTVFLIGLLATLYAFVPECNLIW